MTALRRSLHAAAAAGLALLALAPVAHAQAITNPAQHPASITVTIDGQTYHDGLDTLPGYDDYACTPIPNVQYDFADDQIQYYSGDGDLIDTAHWTEWARISSYDTWAAQQHAAASPSTTATPAPSSTSTSSTTNASTTAPAAATPAATTPAATSPATKTTRSSTQTTHSTTKTTSAAKTTTSSPPAQRTTPQATATPAATRGTSTQHAAAQAAATPAATDTPADGTSPAPLAAAGASPAGAATPAPTGVAAAATPTPAAQAKYRLVSARTGAARTAENTRAAGIGILLAVFALAGLAYLFGFANRPDFAR